MKLVFNQNRSKKTTGVLRRFLETTQMGDLSVVDNTSQMATKVTEDGATTYVALAPAGTTEATAGWQAYRVVVSGATTTITWADGNTLYDNIATNLSALTYA